MRIGIIAAGPTAGVLARLLLKAGHEVAVAASGGEPAELGGLVDELGDRAVPTSMDAAARFGPVAVVSLPVGRYQELPTEALAGRTVIDAGSPDGVARRPGLDREPGPASGRLQARLPGARVVRALHSVRWDRLREYGRQSSALRRYQIPVSGDDPVAKRLVFDLVEQLGYEPVDAGPLTGRNADTG